MSPVCQETVLWTSVSDCKWCHPQALKMCRGGKWAPLWFYITPAPIQHFGTFIKCYHNCFSPPPPTPTLWTTLYICKTNFSTRAHVLVREHRLHVNSGQMWGDMRSRDAAGFSESLTVGLLMSSAGNTQSWNTWALLFYLNCASPTVFFFSAVCVCLILCRHRGRVVSSNDVMALTKHWKDYLIGPWWSLVLSSAVQTVLFIVLKLWFPMGNFSFSFIVSLTKRRWINLKFSFT